MPIYPVRAVLPSGAHVRANIACSEKDPLNRTFKARPGRFYEEDLLLALAAEYTAKGWPGGWILDVGSHVGNHTSFFAHLGPVMAFEADPRCQAAWLQTIAASSLPNPTVLVPAPVWSEERRMDLSRNRTGRVHAVEREKRGGALAVTLDKMASGLSVAIIKMDIEGGERHALRGAFHLLTRDVRPVLAIECKTPDALVRVEAELADMGARYQRGMRYAATPTYVFRPV